MITLQITMDCDGEIDPSANLAVVPLFIVDLKKWSHVWGGVLPQNVPGGPCDTVTDAVAVAPVPELNTMATLAAPCIRAE
jgi:hypothetical protein